MPRFSRPVARSRTSGSNTKKRDNFSKTKMRSQSASNPSSTATTTETTGTQVHPFERMFSGKINANFKHIKKKLDTVRSNDSKNNESNVENSDFSKNLACSRKK